MSKIFVSIACFMDSDIIHTIDDCLASATYPENIVFGICYQHDPNDDCLKKYEHNKQFKIIKMNWKEAKGPAYARGVIYDLFSDENYYLQIDCHSRFYKNWDTNIINCYHECKKMNNKIIISYYPINILNMNKPEHENHIANITTVRCIDKHVGIKTHGRFIDINDAPKTSWGLSAAMLFFDREAYYEVPFDKEIYHGLQFEEQVVLAARYWTHGYDICTPNKHIISTEYITNTKRYSERPIINTTLKNQTYQRLTHLLKLDYNPTFDNNNYLGNERKIEDYYKMLMIYDKVKEVFPNNYLDKIPIRSSTDIIKIGSIGNGYHFSTYFMKYIFNLAYPGKKLQFSNTEDCNVICFTHFTRIENYWNKTPKPFILWNGESYPLPSNINNCKEKIICSSVENSNVRIPYAFHAFIEYQQRQLWLKYKSNINDRKKLIGYCVSANRGECERNTFIDKISNYTQNVYSLGGYTLNGHKQEKITGKWNSEELQKKYSEFKFILAGENKIRDGYITEKIINVFSSGAIPIYIGDSDYAKKIFNKSAFVCVSDFKSIDDCLRYIVNLTEQELVRYQEAEIFSNQPESELFTQLYNKDTPINKSIIKTITDLLKIHTDSLDSVVINLEKEHEKMITMKKKLNHFQIPYSRFSAIYGQEVYDNLKNKKQFLNNGYNLRPHQIGCWQSHFQIWKKMIRENKKQLLIFEDDCSFVVDFKEKLNESLEFIKNKNVDICFLGYSGANINIQNNFSLIRGGCPRCLHAYILTLNGAKKLVNKMEIIDFPIDEIIGRMFLKNELIGYRSSYLLVYQPWQKNKEKYPLPGKYKENYQDLI